MSLFTVLIIIGAIYQLYAAATKKKGTPETRQTLEKRPDSLYLPDVHSIGDVMQEISRGTWKEQLKQALDNGSYQAGTFASTVPEAFEETKDNYGITRENEKKQAIPSSNEHIGMLGSEVYKSTAELPPAALKGMNSPELEAIQLSLAQRDLVQAVIWAEILGKPRALHPYSGPRT